MTRRPQPVLDAAQASAVATALTALLVAFLARHGWLLPDEVTGPVADLIEVGVVAAVGALSSIWAALRARARVTPLVDARGDDGRPLIPAPRARPERDVDPAAPTVEAPFVNIAALRREYNLD